MKILTLSNSPLNEMSGSGYIITGFCRELKARGHTVDLFGPEDYELVKSMRPATTYRKALGMLFFALQQTKESQYDVIEFYGVESWLTAMILPRLSARKHLLVSHSNGLEAHSSELLIRQVGSYRLDGKKPAWHQKLLAPLFEKAFTTVDGIVTVSDFDLVFAEKHGYQAKSRLVAIENSLPTDFLNLAPSFQREPVIGFCGSWLLRKGKNLIGPAIERVLDDFPGTTFRLIGVGQAFKPGEHFPARLLPRIEVIPYVENKVDLRIWYESIAIHIMPSIYESFGLAAAESMACGCALVSTKVGLAYSLQDGKEAVIIEPTADSLYDGILQLLSNDQLRVSIAQCGHQSVQRLRWDRAAERLIETYERWLSEIR
jgi:glycosyltransferase involved in cell wall biosynthesis